MRANPIDPSTAVHPGSLFKTAAILLVVSQFLAGCALPSLEGRTMSTALDPVDAASTVMGRAFAPQIAGHPGQSGIYLLDDPYDAFAARLLLTRAAERTLDIQYYIWHKDVTGILLLEAIHEAADRGVRIRMLLDDNGTVGLDLELAALNSHPNIEIRLFNPFRVRNPKWIGFVTDFSRLNRRMHNKSFTADNQATIIGGRNIGDEYFGATTGVLFTDLDVLAAGPIVYEVSLDFDRYWQSDSSYPADMILPEPERGGLEKLHLAAEEIELSTAAYGYLERIQTSNLIRSIVNQNLELEWVDIRMISDDPAKGLGRIDDDGLMLQQLFALMDRPEESFYLVSAYFVPTRSGVDFLTALADDDIEVAILTNSLDATDVGMVHSGYAKRRKPLLQAGIRLYEMKRLSAHKLRNQSAGPFGSSGASLHAKTFVADRRYVFIGSFNFDPRSANLNTEMGFLIDSRSLGERMAVRFEEQIPPNTYGVFLNERERLYWVEETDGELIHYDHEPHVGWWRRSFIFLLSTLPIEWLL